MIDKCFFTYHAKYDKGIRIEWFCTIFGYILPGSNWTGLEFPTDTTTCNSFMISLYNIVLRWGLTATDDIRAAIKKTKTIPLLSAILGQQKTIEVPVSKPNAVIKDGVEYTIQTLKRKKGYRLLMPLFPSESGIVYSVSSPRGDVVDFSFFKPIWNTLNHPLHNFEIINAAIALKDIVDRSRENLKQSPTETNKEVN